MSNLTKYKIISTLGSGCFSKVKKAIDLETNEYVAIKIIKKCDKNPMSAITKEIQIHKQLVHENIIHSPHLSLVILTIRRVKGVYTKTPYLFKIRKLYLIYNTK